MLIVRAFSVMHVYIRPILPRSVIDLPILCFTVKGAETNFANFQVRENTVHKALLQLKKTQSVM